MHAHSLKIKQKSHTIQAYNEKQQFLPLLFILIPNSYVLEEIYLAMSSGIYFSIFRLFINLLNLSNLLTFCYNTDDLASLHLPTIILMSLMYIFACC